MKRLMRRAGGADRYRDRIDAGERLAAHLAPVVDTGALVLGLPRGGVPVAAEVARALGVQLDVIVARKVGAPRQPELAMGAVTADGGVYLDTRIVDHLRVPPEQLDRLIAREREVARERHRRFRGGRPLPVITGRTVVLVDDGLATGATMRAAVHALGRQRPARRIVAVPVGAPGSCEALAEEVDACICLLAPSGFHAVGQYYDDFTPTTDVDVVRILESFRPRAESAATEP